VVLCLKRKEAILMGNLEMWGIIGVVPEARNSHMLKLELDFYTSRYLGTLLVVILIVCKHKWELHVNYIR
jgi:hypothetical protein